MQSGRSTYLLLEPRLARRRYNSLRRDDSNWLSRHDDGGCRPRRRHYNGLRRRLYSGASTEPKDGDYQSNTHSSPPVTSPLTYSTRQKNLSASSVRLAGDLAVSTLVSHLCDGLRLSGQSGSFYASGPRVGLITAQERQRPVWPAQRRCLPSVA